MSTLYVDTINEKTSGNGVQIPGHVLQVVSNSGSQSVSTTSTSFVDAISATITPISTSNKILIIFNGSIYTTSANVQGPMTLFRGTSSSGIDLSNNSTFGFGAMFGVSSGGKGQVSGNYLDSPSTSSAQQYTIAIRSENAAHTMTLGVNSDRYGLTLMEIAQ